MIKPFLDYEWNSSIIEVLFQSNIEHVFRSRITRYLYLALITSLINFQWIAITRFFIIKVILSYLKIRGNSMLLWLNRICSSSITRLINILLKYKATIFFNYVIVNANVHVRSETEGKKTSSPFVYKTLHRNSDRWLVSCGRVLNTARVSILHLYVQMIHHYIR